MRRRGTNQYQVKWGLSAEALSSVVILLVIMLGISILGAKYKHWQDIAWERSLVSPVPEVYAAAPTPKPAPTVENVLAYIGRRDKFGKHGPYVAAKAAMCFVTEGMSASQSDKTVVNTRRINYNCKYEKDGKTTYTSCPAQDFDKAWSVDCGVAQINVAGQSCPESLFDFQTNIDVALEKYESRGNFSAWYGLGCK